MTEHRWKQPFRWGLLLAYDVNGKDLPELGSHDVTSSLTCVAVPVLYMYDVETPEDLGPDDPIPPAEVDVVIRIGGELLDDPEVTVAVQCDSGQLCVGDAEINRVIDVPSGLLEVTVAREPVLFAEYVVLRVCLPDHSPGGPS